MMGLRAGLVEYHCIECGRKAKELYHDYQNGIIKIAHCVHCQGVVDKYIEFDPVVIFLDAFLLKRPAFRHVFYNTNLQSHWKLTLVFLLCDAYTKLFQFRGPVSEKLKPDYVFYSALEWNLYAMFFQAFAELAVCFLVIYLSVWGVQKWRRIHSSPFSEIVRAVLLSNFGKLFVVPAILWGQSDGLLYLWLTKTFVLAANVQAIRVVCHFGAVVSLGLVSLGHVSQQFASNLLQHYHKQTSIT